MSITLRPYQIEAIRSIRADWDAGLTDVLLTMATGLGKTAVFLTLLNEVLTEGKRGLVLAHRKELIDQPLARLISYYPHWSDRAGIVMADVNQPDRQLTVATVQSLAASARRLDEILSHGPIDYLIVDECHHFTDKNSYMAVLEVLRDANPNLRHLGVTATPIRADGDGLGGVYQKESAHFGIVEGIRAGYLAPVRWLAIQTSIRLDGVKTVDGDFQRKGLANVFETDNCFDLVVESHRKWSGDRQAAAFTVTVEGAYKLAEKFNEAGILAAAADGTTDKRRRAAILDDFANGRIQVLCNVGLYTEGLDVPQISCIHQVRPTKSDGLYTQIIGRALRTYPGKQDALILDYCPVDSRNIAMAGDVLGIPLRRDVYLTEKEEPGEVQGGFTFDGKASWLTGSPAEIVARQLDYLDLSPWSWYRAEDGWLSLGLGSGSDHIERTLVISPAADGQMTLYGVWRRADPEGGRKGSWNSAVIRSGLFDELQEAADGYCNSYGDATLASKSRAWRKQPPSDSQIKYARQLKGCWKPGATKGELAQRITHAVAMQSIVARQLRLSEVQYAAA